MDCFSVSTSLAESSPKLARFIPTDPVNGAPRDREWTKWILLCCIQSWSASSRLRLKIKTIMPLTLWVGTLNLWPHFSPSAESGSWVACSRTFGVGGAFKYVCFAFSVSPFKCWPCHLPAVPHSQSEPLFSFLSNRNGCYSNLVG